MTLITSLLYDTGSKLQAHLFVLCTSIIGFMVVKYFWDRKRLYYYASIVGGPFAWPIVGNGFYFSGGTDDILENIMFLLGNFRTPARVWLGQRLFFTITQPKDLEIILNNCLHKEQLYELTRPIVGSGVFSAPVDQWKRHRKNILPAFNQKILHNFQPIFSEHADALVDKLEEKVGTGIFDVYPFMNRCTVEIICESALGQKVSIDSKDNTFVFDVARGMELTYIRMFQIWYHSNLIWNLTSYSVEMRQISARIKTFLMAIINDKKLAYRKRKKLGDEYFEDSPQRKSFLDYLVEVSEEGANWTDKEIQDEAVTIAIGGSDSTGSMNSFCLVMLGMHPDIQERVFEELSGIFGDSQRPVELEDLNQMTYLERVLKETMRLFPVGPVIVRALHEDVQLDKCTLPKGGSCVIGIIHTHRDPELWPEPLKFDPDRFLPEHVAKRHPYSYIPFSAGPRNCIGPKYAMMSMKTVMATVLRRFRVSTDYKSVAEIKIKADLMIKSVHGCRISLELR